MMFRFFKKKESNLDNERPFSRGQQFFEIAKAAASILELALVLGRSTDEYEGKLRSDYVRGYFLGFFEAAAQFSGLELTTAEDIISFITLGHTELLRNDVPDTEILAYINGSLSVLIGKRQATKDFAEGQSLGKSEYFAFMNSKSVPTGLLEIFHPSVSDGLR